MKDEPPEFNSFTQVNGELAQSVVGDNFSLRRFGPTSSLMKRFRLDLNSALLLGENQDKRVIVLMLLPPAAFVAFILLSYSITWKSVLTSLLAFDIFAGLLSNLQEKTHQAWKKLPRANLIAFVVVHLTLYPLVVVLFQVSFPLMMLMLVMLFTKTVGFAIGTNLW